MSGYEVCDIYEEFERLSSIELEQSMAIGYGAQHVGGKGGFSVRDGLKIRHKKEPKIMLGHYVHKLTPFAELLRNGKTIKEAALEVEIGYGTAVKYTYTLIRQAEKFGRSEFSSVELPKPRPPAKVRILKGVWARPNVKLTEAEVRGIRVMSAAGYSTYKIAKLYDVHPSTIYQIVTWLSWKNIEAPGIKRPLSLLEQIQLQINEKYS